MNKDLIFDATGKDETDYGKVIKIHFYKLGEFGDSTEVIFELKKVADLATVIEIVNSVYNGMIHYMANGVDMYAVKYPLLIYYIADKFSSIDVSSILNRTIDENGNEVLNLDINKADLFASSQYGIQIYKAIINDLNNNEYNSLTQIHKLLDKKIEMFERQVLSNSPTDDVINEVYSLVHEFKEFAEKLSKQADKIDVSKVLEGLNSMTPQNIVEEYLKASRKNKSTNDTAKKTISEYKNYKQNRINRQKRTLMPEAGKDIITLQQKTDGE